MERFPIKRRRLVVPVQREKAYVHQADEDGGGVFTQEDPSPFDRRRSHPSREFLCCVRSSRLICNLKLCCAFYGLILGSFFHH